MLLLRKIYHDGVPGPAHLFVEGMIAAGLGTFFAGWLFPAEASLMSVSLASLTAIDSLDRLLKWNRWAIFKRGISPSRANFRLFAQLLALFLGALVGYVAISMVLPRRQIRRLFKHQVEDSMAFGDWDFGSFTDLFSHNLYVLVFFFCIALPFRQGGVMLAIAWNASVWGITVGLVARDWSETDGPGLVEALARVMTAITPHMALEACGYVLIGQAGVFLSKALVKHELDSDVMIGVLKTVGVLAGIAAGLVLTGAAVEAWIAPVLVRVLAG